MITRRHLMTGLGLAIPASLAGGLASARGGGVTLFAAASLETALTAIGRAYRGRPGAPLRLAFGASSAMARQIAQGAPADVFISADIDWMDWLETRGGVVAGTRRNLLANRLVLIAPKASSIHLRITPGMPLAAALGGGRLAVADPAAVPAGKYARQALTHLGVWDSVRTRLVPAENVRTALAYVARGEAPLGLVYATDAAVEPRVRVVGTFPAGSHKPIVYPAALVRDSAAGRAVMSHLSSPAAMARFRAQGFLKP